VPLEPFVETDLPSFDQAPSVVLITGAMDFFVEEAAAKVAEALTKGGAERIRFDDDASPEAVSDALLNRSLFSPRRVVELDVTRLLGTEAPGALLDAAVEAWEKGSPAGRREAFRHARALLSALGLTRGPDPVELAETVCRKTRRKESAAAVVDLLRELPEEKGSPALLLPTLRRILERGNDGVVALLTATAPPKGAELSVEIAKKGLVLQVGVGEMRDALPRYARARARDREVTLDGDAIERLRFQTNERPELFAAELSKLLEWAGKGGRVRGADVQANVEDEASEDLYLFFDSIGRRDAGDALRRLERLFSGRDVKLGDRGDRLIETDSYWPLQFFGMLTTELRRMLLLLATLDRAGQRWDPAMSYATFQARLSPRLEEPVAPFGRSPFESAQGKFSHYLWFKVAQRAARYQASELARSLAGAAEVDVQLKTSTPPLEALSAYVGRLIAGE
jgi:DNA polymerase III delta subunit